MDAIRVERLTKRYGDVLAVDAIDFAVPARATVGPLGGNGAGMEKMWLRNLRSRLQRLPRHGETKARDLLINYKHTSAGSSNSEFHLCLAPRCSLLACPPGMK
jgi:ABC-type uncharacterized transport system ATPase subunit